MKNKMDIGVIGLSVMGSNLALNLADHGFQVMGFNRSRGVDRKTHGRTAPPQFVGGLYDGRIRGNALTAPADHDDDQGRPAGGRGDPSDRAPSGTGGCAHGRRQHVF